MKPLRHRLHEIIFESDTRAGRLFDVTLLWVIVLSVAAVMLESVASIRQRYGRRAAGAEWIFTILFTLEYVVRLLVLKRPLAYVFSFFGLVDLLSFVPTYLSAFVPGAQALIAVPDLPGDPAVPDLQAGEPHAAGQGHRDGPAPGPPEDRRLPAGHPRPSSSRWAR